MTQEKLKEANKLNDKIRSIEDTLKNIKTHNKCYGDRPIKIEIPIARATSISFVTEDLYVYNELKTKILAVIFSEYDLELNHAIKQLQEL